MKLSSVTLGGVMSVVFLFAACLEARGETRHPAEEKGLKSIHSDVEALITFHNQSGAPVKICWLDFAGNRVLYLTLNDGDQIGQATYLTHPWLVTDEGDNPLGLYYADGQPRTVEIKAVVKP